MTTTSEPRMVRTAGEVLAWSRTMDFFDTYLKQ